MCRDHMTVMNKSFVSETANLFKSLGGVQGGEELNLFDHGSFGLKKNSRHKMPIRV